MSEPLSPDEIAALRESVERDAAAIARGDPDWTPMQWTGAMIARLLATLDAAQPDTRLREALQWMLDEPTTTSTRRHLARCSKRQSAHRRRK